MASIVIDRADGLSSSTAIKGPVRVATTANLTLLQGYLTVDGILLEDGDRVLVKDQTSGQDNGIYVVALGPWNRAKDFNRNRDVTTGTLVYATSGSSGRGFYQLATAEPIAIGTTVLSFTRITPGSDYQGSAIRPQDFGAAADGVTDDTVAVQAAIDFAAASGVNVVDFGEQGTFKLTVGATSPFNYGNFGVAVNGGVTSANGIATARSQLAPVLSALTINYSNLTLKGSGAKIIYSAKRIVDLTSVVDYAGATKTLNHRGAWVSGTAYAVGDVVTVGSSYYYCFNAVVLGASYTAGGTVDGTLSPSADWAVLWNGDAGVGARTPEFWALIQPLNYAMRTNKNASLTGVQNLTFDGLVVDVNPTSANNGLTARSALIVGATGVTLRNTFTTSSAASGGTNREAGTWSMQNVSKLSVRGAKWRGTTQCMNLSYIDDIEVSDFESDNYNEALDFDRVCSNIRATNLAFFNGSGSGPQAMDLNSVTDVVITNLIGKTGGNLFGINRKTTTPALYSDYLLSPGLPVDPSAYVPARNVTITNVNVKSMGTSGNNPIVVDASATGIRIGNVTLEDCAGCQFNEAYVDLFNWNIIRNTTEYCIYSNYGTTLRGRIRLRDIYIEDAAGIAVYASNPSVLDIKGLRVNGYNQSTPSSARYGIRLLNGAAIDKLYLDDIDISGGTNATADISLSATSVANFFWGDNIYLRSTNPLAISSGMQDIVPRYIERNFGPAYVPAASEDYLMISADAKTRWVIARSSIIPLAALAADGSDYITWAFRRYVSGSDASISGLSGNFTAGVAATTETALGTVQTALPGAGDTLYVRLNKAGTGGAGGSFKIRTYALPYKVA